MKKKPKLEGAIWNYASTSTRERLVSHALIRLQNKNSSRAPFQDLDVSLAKNSWDELRQDTQKQITKLLRDATTIIGKDGSDIRGVLEKQTEQPLHQAVQNAVSDAIVKFALRDK